MGSWRGERGVVSASCTGEEGVESFLIIMGSSLLSSGEGDRSGLESRSNGASGACTGDERVDSTLDIGMSSSIMSRGEEVGSGVGVRATEARGALAGEEGVEDFLIMGVSSIKSTGDGVLDSSYTSSLSSSWYLSFSSATLDEIQPSLTSSSSLFVCSSLAPSISSSSSSLSLMSSLLYSSWSSSVSELSDSVA